MQLFLFFLIKSEKKTKRSYTTVNNRTVPSLIALSHTITINHTTQITKNSSFSFLKKPSQKHHTQRNHDTKKKKNTKRKKHPTKKFRILQKKKMQIFNLKKVQFSYKKHGFLSISAVFFLPSSVFALVIFLIIWYLPSICTLVRHRAQQPTSDLSFSLQTRSAGNAWQGRIAQGGGYGPVQHRK